MKKVFTLTLALMASFSLWADSYVPLGVKNITKDTIVYASGITAAGTPATDWVVVPTYGTESKTYTNVTSDTKGNPTGITDNLSTQSSQTMIKIKADGNTYTSDKRVVIMHVKGIVGLIAHGYTGNSGRGMIVGCDVFTNSLTTPTQVASINRSGSGGSYLVAHSGLDATKEYIISFYADSKDNDFYAVEFFTPEADHTKATVTNITVNGEDLAGFDPETQNYNVELAIGTVDIPTVAATTGDDATVVITQATELPGTASVVCTSYDEQTEITYTLNFTVKTSESSDATLSALSVEGCTLNETFDPDVEDYTITLATCYTAMPVVGDVTATKNDAFAEDPVVTIEGNVITIACEAEDGTPKTYTITVSTPAATELVSISESTTWDWTNAGSATGEQTATTLPTNAEEFNFADVLISPANTFNAAALSGIAQFANRGTYFQGTQIKFNTTKPGKVVVTYSNTGGSRPYRHVEVNGTLSEEGSANQDMKDTEEFAVTAGDVIIKFYIPDATKPQERSGDNVGYAMGRISKIVFTKDPETSLDNTTDEVKAVKYFKDGQLFIEKNGHVYNVFGACVK